MSLLSDFDVVFDESDSRDGAYARAAAGALEAIMDDFILHLEDLQADKVTPLPVKHVGENPLELIYKGKSRDYNCFKYESIRYTLDEGQLISELKRFDWSRYPAATRELAIEYKRVFVEGLQSEAICRKPAHYCDAQARVLRYGNFHDISPCQIALAMARARASLASGILMYPGIFAPASWTARCPSPGSHSPDLRRREPSS